MSAYRGTVMSYIAGFVLSLACTLGAYFVVVGAAFSAPALLGAVVALGFFQLCVQLVLFLHLGLRAPWWNVAAFIFALIVVGIVIVGSLWIMQNLNTRMMLSPEQMSTYMDSQAGL